MSKFKAEFFFIIFLVVLAAIVGIILIFNKPQKKMEGKAVLPIKNLSEAVQAPSQEVPQTNPFEEIKTNPFKDVKTNPFDI